jgi:hypothetical protein
MIVAAAGPAIQLAQSITFRLLKMLSVIGASPVGRGRATGSVRRRDLARLRMDRPWHR